MALLRVARMALPLASTALLAAACAAPLQTPGQSGATGPTIADELSDAVVAPWSSTLPLRPEKVDGVPFRVWTGSGVQDLAVVELAETVDAEADVDYQLLGSTSGHTDAQVLTMMAGGTAFATGSTPHASRPTVGLLGTQGAFQAFADVPGVQSPQYLPEPVPFRALNATGAGSWNNIVVWAGVGSGGKQWSLMGWNASTGVVAELSSASSMTLGATGISARMVPGLKAPVVNGKYAYFEVAIPQSVYDAATPGIRFHEISAEGLESSNFGVAVFRVPLTSPGDAVFVGPSTQVAADAAHGDGMFWVSTPSSDADSQADEDLVGDLAHNAETAQSGQETDALATPGLQGYSYSQLLETATGRLRVGGGTPNLFVWRTQEAVQPLFAAGSTDEWVVTDIDASDEILAVALTRVEGLVENAEGEDVEPEAWVLAWDLESASLVGAAQSEVPVPELFVSGDILVWSETQESIQAGGKIIAAPEVDGEASSYVWRAGDERVLRLTGVSSPRVGGDIVAIKTAEGDSAGIWTFLRWGEEE